MPDDQPDLLSDADQRIARMEAHLRSTGSTRPPESANHDARPKPQWNIFSIFAFLLGVLLVTSFVFFLPDRSGSWGSPALGYSIIAIIGCTLLGGICAIVSLFRKEAKPGLTVTGLCLNCAPWIYFFLANYRR